MINPIIYLETDHNFRVFLLNYDGNGSGMLYQFPFWNSLELESHKLEFGIWKLENRIWKLEFGKTNM